MKFAISLVKWLLVIFLGLPLLAYLLLILLNINDEAKSDTVVEFEQFFAERLTVDDKHNGFVYAAGLSASLDENFYSVGLDRIKQANSIKPLSVPTSEQKLLTERSENLGGLPPC